MLTLHKKSVPVTYQFLAGHLTPVKVMTSGVRLHPAHKLNTLFSFATLGDRSETDLETASNR